LKEDQPVIRYWSPFFTKNCSRFHVMIINHTATGLIQVLNWAVSSSYRYILYCKCYLSFLLYISCDRCRCNTLGSMMYVRLQSKCNMFTLRPWDVVLLSFISWMVLCWNYVPVRACEFKGIEHRAGSAYELTCSCSPSSSNVVFK